MQQDETHERQLTIEQTTPLGLDLRLSDQVLEVRWADGVTGRYPLAFLRRHCPCATCRTEREQRSRTLLPILTGMPSAEARVTGGSMVGNYAVQLQWSDGHDSGIFDFRYLRSLDSVIPKPDQQGAG